MRTIFVESASVLLSFLCSVLPFQESTGKQKFRDSPNSLAKSGTVGDGRADQEPTDSKAADEPVLDDRMPAPLPQLDNTIPFKRKLFLGEQDIVKKPKLEIAKLAALHVKRFEQIKTVQGSAWTSFVRPGNKQGTTILVDYYYQNSPAKSKILTKYLPFELRGQRPGPEVFETKFAEINTPGMHVFSDGEFGKKVAKGLSSITVKKSGSRPVDHPFNFDTLFLPSFYVTETKRHFSELELQLQQDKYKTEVRTRGDLMELRLWSTRTSQEFAFRWICDLSKDGNVVYFDSISKIGEIEYRKNDGLWLPHLYHVKQFNRVDSSWKEEKLIRYFDISVNQRLNQDQFTVQSLPVRDFNVQVTDRRVAPYPRVPVSEFTEE